MCNLITSYLCCCRSHTNISSTEEVPSAKYTRGFFSSLCTLISSIFHTLFSIITFRWVCSRSTRSIEEDHSHIDNDIVVSLDGPDFYSRQSVIASSLGTSLHRSLDDESIRETSTCLAELSLGHPNVTDVKLSLSKIEGEESDVVLQASFISEDAEEIPFGSRFYLSKT